MKDKGKIGLTLYFVLSFIILAPGTAKAYIDPSMTTFIVQAVVGVGVAIVAGVAVYWRRAKKKVSKALGIDENANKAVEEDVVEFKDDTGK